MGPSRGGVNTEDTLTLRIQAMPRGTMVARAGDRVSATVRRGDAPTRDCDGVAVLMRSKVLLGVGYLPMSWLGRGTGRGGGGRPPAEG